MFFEGGYSNSSNDSIPWTDIIPERLNALEYLSITLGWAYFVAWSVSFYPQVKSNWDRKSVVGLSFDFLFLNITGYIGYSIFNCALLFSPEVQEEYLKKHNPPIPVKPNDVAFALHALLLTIITITQCFLYERGDQKIHLVTYVLVALTGVAAIIQLIIILAFPGVGETWLQYIYFWSYVKIGATLLKYIPQAYYNYERKSTVGWSIGNILLDLTGGVLSFAQLFVDAINSQNYKVITGDPAKLALSLISIAFDMVFMVQHYCLYREKEIDPTVFTPLKDQTTGDE